MIRSIFLFLFMILFAIQTAAAQDSAMANKVDWARFSTNLVRAFEKDNDGLHQSAMQHIIRFSDYLDVDDAVYDIMRIYRNHNDDRVRQLALVTLHKMQNGWANAFMKRCVKFEKNPTLKKILIASIAETEMMKMKENNIKLNFASAE